MRISDWSSDVCSSDLDAFVAFHRLRSTDPPAPVKNPLAATGRVHRDFCPRCHRWTSVESTDRHAGSANPARSEEHTSEFLSLQRISYAVFCLNKKKYNSQYNTRNPKQQPRLNSRYSSRMHT